MVNGKSLLILIPSYNDWDAVRLLLPRIDSALARSDWTASVLVVDDASSEPLPQHWPDVNLPALDSVDVLHLRCNLGHQRAIALGLYHAHEFTNAEAVLVMDGDGEDLPEHIPALLAEFERSGGREAIFAARTRRMESWIFQVCYRAYKVIHLALTGVEVRAGNFSVLPRSALTRLMAVSDLWNHYAAAVYRARLPLRFLPLARGARIAGRSRMNFLSLLTHGLSAISVFADRVAVRLLAASCVLGVAGLILSAAEGFGLFAIATLALAIQLMSFGLLFALTTASRRSALDFLLLRDAPHFLLGVTRSPGRLGRDLDTLQSALAESLPLVSRGASK